MSNGETSERGALEALLFQRVGVLDPLRHERLRSSIPKVTGEAAARRRRRRPGVRGCRGRSAWERLSPGLPSPPPLRARKLGHTWKSVSWLWI